MKITDSRIIRPVVGAAILALGAMPALAQIGVDVDGRPVQFGTAQPVRMNGRVLIPLRAVVEALGAEVKWDASTQTVRGSKGQREFSLQIGSRTAMVGANSVALDVPAQLISGATMVPLRFVAEALGADVEWNAAAQRVVVNAGAMEQPENPAGQRVAGEVLSVQPQANPPTVTVRANGVRHTYRVGRDTIILRGPEGERGMRVDLEQLQPGDEVSLRIAAGTGMIEVLEAFGGARNGNGVEAMNRVEGEVLAVRTQGNIRTITVRTATGRVTYDLPEEVSVSRIVGTRPAARARITDVQVGDRVRLGTDRRGEVANAIEVLVPEAPRIPAVNGRITGDVVGVNPDAQPPTITVRKGNVRATYEVTADTVLLRGVGTAKATRAGLEEIEPGDTVTLRVDPDSGVAEVVEARATAANPEGLPEPARDLRITSFTHNASAILRSGAQVQLTLLGTPGAIVTADVGTLAKGVTLKEDPQRPGRYTGSFVIPRGATAKDVPVIGQLRVGNRTAPLIQAATALDVDSEAPTISEMAPGDKSEVTNQTPDIYVELSDAAGSGLDMDSIRLLVRDKEVTQDVKVTKRFLIYTPRTPLAPGPVPVTVFAKDLAGNQTQAEWTFTVKPGNTALQSVTHNADRALRAGDVLTVTARGQARGRATFTVGDVARAIPMTETVPGTYVGRYTVRQGDQIDKAPVMVEFVTPAGDRIRQEASAPVNVVTAAPVRPEITSPIRRFALGEELVVEGRAAPGARVTVEVTFVGRAFGALPVKGTFGSQEVTADRNGRWVSGPFQPRLPLGVRRPEVTIRAVSTDAAGTASEPVEVTVQTR